MKAIRLFVLLFIAVNFIACSKGKWDIQPKNSTSIKLRINGNTLDVNKSTSVGKFEKDQSVDIKVALMLTDSIISTEKTYSVKPTTDPSNDGDVMEVTFTTQQQDSTVNLVATVKGAEITIK